MVNKNIISKILITVGTLVVLVIAFAIINTAVSRCDENHVLDSDTNTCHYTSNVCKQGEVQEMVNNINVCSYKPKGFLSSSLVLGIIVSLIVLFLLVLVIMFIFLNKNTGVNKRNRTPEDKIINAFCIWYSKQTGITSFGDSYDSTAFQLQPMRYTVNKGDDEFIKFSILVLKGSQPGLLTVEASLTQGIDFILNGGANYENINSSNYKRPKGYDLYTPQNPMERMLKRYEEINPEKALEKHQEVLEKQLSNNTPNINAQQQEQTDEQNTQPQIIRPASRYNRYRRNYNRR